jgi:predicted PurR-regulated permease PerM
MDRLRTTNVLLTLIAVVLVGAAFRAAEPVFIALLLSVLLVYVLDPLVIQLQRLRLPLWAATIIAAVALVGIVGGPGFFIVRDLLELGTRFPEYQDRILTMVTSAARVIEDSLDLAQPLDLLGSLRGVSLGPFAVKATRSVAAFTLDFALVFFFALIMLIGKHHAAATIANAFPEKKGRPAASILAAIDAHLRAYIDLKALISLLVGLGTTGILLALRVEFAFVWGFLAFLLNFVPGLGPAVAIALPVLTATAQRGFWPTAVLAAVLLALLHVGLSNVLEPKLMGDHLDLSFLVIFVSLLFWGWLWGPAGVLLAVPLTATAKIVLEHIPRTKRFASLLQRSRPRRVA